jgi:hypothetical protein
VNCLLCGVSRPPAMFSTGTVNANSIAVCAIVTTVVYESVTLDFKTWKHAYNKINSSNVQQQKTVCLCSVYNSVFIIVLKWPYLFYLIRLKLFLYTEFYACLL